MHNLQYKNWELVFHAQVTNEELDTLNEAIADYPDVCLTLTGEKHYYAVGSEVPELVQYDASLVFDTAIAKSLDEMKALDETIFQAMYMAKAPQLDPLSKQQKKKSWQKILVSFVAKNTSLKQCLKAIQKQLLLKLCQKNLACLKQKLWRLVMLPTTLKCLNLLIIALLWEMRQTKSNLFAATKQQLMTMPE